MSDSELSIRPLPDPWASWSLVILPMDCAEVIVPAARLVCIDPCVADPVAHAMAHLELGHHETPGTITGDMERWAVQMVELAGLD